MNNRIQEIKERQREKEEVLEYTSLEVPEFYNDIAYLLSEIERLQTEHKVMKEALEFYDSPFIKEQVRMYYFGTTHYDYIGEKARTTLSHLKG